MGALAIQGLLTASDYRALPEAGPRFELIEGELMMAPSPRRSHQDVAGRIYRLLCDFVERAAVGQVYMAPFDVYLDEHDVVQPDVLFLSTGSAKKFLREDGVHGAPDLVVEVLSSGNADQDRKTKRRLYARAGVQELWLADPEARTMEVYRFAEGADRPAFVLKAGDTLTTPLLPGLAAKIGPLFRPWHAG